MNKIMDKKDRDSIKCRIMYFRCLILRRLGRDSIVCQPSTPSSKMWKKTTKAQSQWATWTLVVRWSKSDLTKVQIAHVIFMCNVGRIRRYPWITMPSSPSTRGSKELRHRFKVRALFKTTQMNIRWGKYRRTCRIRKLIMLARAICPRLTLPTQKSRELPDLRWTTIIKIYRLQKAVVVAALTFRIYHL